MILDNGNFIFVWKNGGYWKMVLTNNKGETLKDGWVRPGAPWKDTSKWTINKPAGFYSISNFRGKDQATIDMEEENARWLSVYS